MSPKRVNTNVALLANVACVNLMFSMAINVNPQIIFVFERFSAIITDERFWILWMSCIHVSLEIFLWCQHSWANFAHNWIFLGSSVFLQEMTIKQNFWGERFLFRTESTVESFGFLLVSLSWADVFLLDWGFRFCWSTRPWSFICWNILDDGDSHGWFFIKL